MGIIVDKLTGRGKDTFDAPDFDWLDESTTIDGGDRQTIEHQGKTYACRAQQSPTEEWIASFGFSKDCHQHRLFIFRHTELWSSTPLEHPQSCVIANDGTVVVADRGDSHGLGGNIRVVDKDGNTILSKEFQSNISAIEITDNGKYAAVVTLAPDCQTHIFDINQRQLIATHDNQEGNKHRLKYQKSNNEWNLFLSSKNRSTPLYAIDIDGEITWKSDRFVGNEPFVAGLLRRG